MRYSASGDRLLFSLFILAMSLTAILPNSADAVVPFTDSGAVITGLSTCSVAWGDYDKDGKLDLAICGNTGSARVTKIYHNNGNGTFSDIVAELVGVSNGALAWGDMDNDGDLDLAVTGYTGSAYVAKVYTNMGSDRFTDVGAELRGVRYSSLAWGDYDNDGRLDVAIAGYTGSAYIGQIYHGNPTNANTAPTAPNGLTTTVVGTSITFNWAAATDTKTPSTGLSYNLRVGTASGKDDVYCGMANLSSGLRFVPANGNAQKRLSWTLSNLPIAPYYWSIQAIDTSFAGSAWATEQSIGVVKISGHVVRASGVAMQGVSMTATGLSSVTTDAAGYYEFTVFSGWSGTITPGKPLFSFSPASKSYTNVTIAQSNQDFSVAESFTQISSGLTDLFVSHLAWGDYNNDGYLDLVVAGSTVVYPSYDTCSRVYRNNANGTFTNVNANLINNFSTNALEPWDTVLWTDYNNDGYLDLAMSGNITESYSSGIDLFCNTGGVFTTAVSPAQAGSSGQAWGDYDNDGLVDVASGGIMWNGQRYVNSGAVFRNTGYGFTSSIQLGAFSDCACAWADYDNDGDLDLAVAAPTLAIYRNDGNNVFTNVCSLGINADAIAWGDYDSDGDLDLVAVGKDTTIAAAAIFRNDNGQFTRISAGLTGVTRG